MLLHCLNSFGYIEASANAPIQQENLQDMSQAMFFLPYWDNSGVLEKLFSVGSYD